MNAPENFELFIIPEGKNKVEYVEDSKHPNTGVFTILLEDHTIGNMLKMQLLRDERIRFSGYRKPHPLENKVELRVSTNGECTPGESLKQAIHHLVTDIDQCSKRFSEEVIKLRK
jgi:DNA-directed RNA polymerase II subunit RPB11